MPNSSKARVRRRQPHGLHLTYGHRTAIKAIAAARQYLKGSTSIWDVATASGLTIAHVEAAVTLVKSQNSALLNKVLAGDLPLSYAARQAQRVVNLVEAYRQAAVLDRVAWVRQCGPEKILSDLIAAERKPNGSPVGTTNQQA